MVSKVQTESDTLTATGKSVSIEDIAIDLKESPKKKEMPSKLLDDFKKDPPKVDTQEAEKAKEVISSVDIGKNQKPKSKSKVEESKERFTNNK